MYTLIVYVNNHYIPSRTLLSVDKIATLFFLFLVTSIYAYWSPEYAFAGPVPNVGVPPCENKKPHLLTKLSSSKVYSSI